MQQIKENLAATGLEVTTTCVGFTREDYTREDYTDIPAVRATVGLVPEETRSDRVRIISDISHLANKLGIRPVASHIGFIL